MFVLFEEHKNKTLDKWFVFIDSVVVVRDQRSRETGISAVTKTQKHTFNFIEYNYTVYHIVRSSLCNQKRTIKSFLVFLLINRRFSWYVCCYFSFTFIIIYLFLVFFIIIFCCYFCLFLFQLFIVYGILHRWYIVDYNAYMQTFWHIRFSVRYTYSLFHISLYLVFHWVCSTLNQQLNSTNFFFVL